MWNYNPRTTGGHYGSFYLPNPTSDGRIGGTWTRTYTTADFNGICTFLVNYVTDTDPNTFAIGDGDQRGYGYNYLEFEAADAAVPTRPTLTFIGAAGFRANDLRFQSSAFADPQGAGTFAAMQWRIGEIAAPGVAGYTAGDPFTYEISDVWTSAEIAPFNNQIAIPVNVARPGHTYRARVRMKDNTGRWSRWSAAVQFVATAPDISVFQQALVVSEVNYNPLPVTPAEFAAGFSSDDFEWVEVKNVSASPVAMTNVRFTKGVDFDFTAGFTIPAGGFALVVKNQAAFVARWGASYNGIIAGVFPGDNFNNGGELVKLSYGAGTEILSFTYANVAPWPTAPDGTGRTLNLRNPNMRPAQNVATNWKASYAPTGTPGADDLLTFALWSADYPGVVDPAADSDGDGAKDGVEYALFGNPSQSNSGILPAVARQTITVEGVPAQYLTITFTKRTDTSDLLYQPQYSTDVASWSATCVLVTSTPNADGTVTEMWRAPVPMSGGIKQFVRLRVL